jgi:hypothetical protein
MGTFAQKNKCNEENSIDIDYRFLSNDFNNKRSKIEL